MTYLLYKRGMENCYTSFSIEKKDGTSREIHAPYSKLKKIQRKIASLIWEQQIQIWKNFPKSFELNIKQDNLPLHERYRVPLISHAFEKNKSILTNATVHRNKRFVLNIDLKDFFGSFHFGRVRGFFEKNKNFKVPSDVAIVLAQLCCYNGTLPQGSPSSPIITNLICSSLDYRILGIAKKYQLYYTRYADDLTFSTNSKVFIEKLDTFLEILKLEIERLGFEINPSKTRLQYNCSRQSVTGVVVNKKLGVPKEYSKSTRAMANHFYRNGEFYIGDRKGTINQLEGRFSFINQIDRYNNNIEKLFSLKKNSINNQKFLLSSRDKPYGYNSKKFNSREIEYQKFLFYKYFFGNSKPLIITEGKTDIKYLKAALKNLYKEYPKLIEKKETNGKMKFIFQISFLNKTNRLQYFFKINNGADGINSLYSLYSDKDNHLFPNYYNQFKSKKYIESKNPVICIFDNEIENSKKPIQKFLNYANATENNLSELKNDLHTNIINNLHVLTHPLSNNTVEGEIEDLFSKETLEKKIKGKSFSRTGGKDFYGKDIFSKYIYDNYEKIDFDGFKPLLNALNDLV